MKQLILFCLICLQISAVAQHAAVYIPKPEQPEKYFKIEMAIPLGLALFSGVAYGVNQANENHADQMFLKHPGLSRRRWGDDSWKNKYWNFDPEQGRNNVPVWFTDADHATASANQSMMFCAGLSIPLIRKKSKHPVLHYAFDAGLSFITYSAGWIIGDKIMR